MSTQTTSSDASEATPAGPRSRSQTQRRKRIVQAAAALASRGGVEAMQMRTVAERAGVALGTLYRYFPSKMDLVVAVVAEELDLLEASFKRRPPTGDDSARRAVDVLVRATRGLMREPELADALVRSLILTNEDTTVGDRLVELMMRVATGDDAAVMDPDSERHVLVSSLVSVWTTHLLGILRDSYGIETVQSRLEVAADRLLADF
ncbi:MAG: TetR family transcriptional regulator [Streptosporangiales bacterium]|nr:TetR family transcriptional regulator [Streptosporangiales bacterium]